MTHNYHISDELTIYSTVVATGEQMGIERIAISIRKQHHHRALSSLGLQNLKSWYVDRQTTFAQPGNDWLLSKRIQSPAQQQQKRNTFTGTGKTEKRLTHLTRAKTNHTRTFKHKTCRRHRQCTNKKRAARLKRPARSASHCTHCCTKAAAHAALVAAGTHVECVVRLRRVRQARLMNGRHVGRVICVPRHAKSST